MNLAEGMGLVVDRPSCLAHGLWDGYPFKIGVKTVRRSKSNAIVLWAEMVLPGCPAGFSLSEETMLAGLYRTFGGKEPTIGDAEFDAVFFVDGTANVDEVREFLTPPVRRTLAACLPAFEGRLENGAVVSETTFLTPLAMESRMRTLLQGFRQLAQGMSGQEEFAEETRLDPVGRKLRKFAARSLLLWIPLLLGSLVQFGPGAPVEGRLLQAGILSGLLLTIAVYRGNDVARVLLQSLYAFSALASAGILLFGMLESVDVLASNHLRISEDDVLTFLVCWGTLALTFWGARHYLKILDRGTTSRRGVS